MKGVLNFRSQLFSYADKSTHYTLLALNLSLNLIQFILILETRELATPRGRSHEAYASLQSLNG